MSKEDEKPEAKESEKILEQIEAMKNGTTPPDSKTSTPESKTDGKAPDSTPEKAPKPTADTAAPDEGKAEDTKAPTDKKEGKPEVDLREWAKRKGFKENDQESVLKSYRELERKLSQVTAQKKEPEAPQWQPQPQLPVPPAYPPAYPPPYMDRRAILEAEAARFNMTPEDMERLLPLVNEVTQLNQRKLEVQLQQKYDARLSELDRENKRNTEFNSLMADPDFTRPEVAFEIDRLLSENPHRLKLEPTPWVNVFKDALQNIARKKLQNGNEPEEAGVSHPTNPPKEGGKGSTPPLPDSNSQNTILEKFKKSDVKGMQEMLVSMGALQPPEH